MKLQRYMELLDYHNIPSFMYKYFNSPSLKRLNRIGYFCGMDYASKDIYNFSEYVSRFSHSLTTALLTWKLTYNKTSTIAALFHDISTPCFSHVIDYMNKDYRKQESTEEFTEKIILNDDYLLECLEKDNIKIDDIINFKNNSIVDLDRPMMCADRLDGIILTSLFWTKSISLEEVEMILKSVMIYNNEYNNLELGFNDKLCADLVIEKNNKIDIYCHSMEDNYMMELLANITRMCIDKKIISYDELYLLNEHELIFKMINSRNTEILNLWYKFNEIKKEEIKYMDLPLIKKRVVTPIVNGKRISQIND